MKTELLAAHLKAVLSRPNGGGWATDPGMSQRAIIKMTSAARNRLKRLAIEFSKRTGLAIAPMTIAAVLLELATNEAIQRWDI